MVLNYNYFLCTFCHCMNSTVFQGKLSRVRTSLSKQYKKVHFNISLTFLQYVIFQLSICLLFTYPPTILARLAKCRKPSLPHSKKSCPERLDKTTSQKPSGSPISCLRHTNQSPHVQYLNKLNWKSLMLMKCIRILMCLQFFIYRSISCITY